MAKSIDPTSIYKLDEVAGIFEVSTKTLQRDIKAGKLTANRVGHNYQFVGANLLAYAGSVNYGDDFFSRKPAPVSSGGVPEQK